MERARECLTQKFGLQDFRQGQAQVIERVIDGKNTAAIFPTGAGKSLCYQLPAVMLPNVTIVVSPLLALMKDQVDALAQRGVCAVRLDSTLSSAESRDSVQKIREGAAKLLFVAPERFFNERFRATIADLPISLFAVDEAHCISQWGHNFRPDYLKLARQAREIGATQYLALTATATEEVANDICREFQIARDDCIRTAFYRSNLQLKFSATSSATATDFLIRRLQPANASARATNQVPVEIDSANSEKQANSEKPASPVPRANAVAGHGATLVYVSLQRTAEHVADELTAAGLNARAYHAGLPVDVRQSIQDWFMSEPAPIVVATIAFGMGIDKRDIRHVFHYNAAKSLENYAQEIGRAGRDGKPSVCESLIDPSDRIVLENFAFGDTPSPDAVRELCRFLSTQPNPFYISFYSLARQFDIRDLVLKTILTYLELDGFLEGIGPRYDQYDFIPRVSSRDILAHFNGERREFMRDLFAMSTKKKKWFGMDIIKICQRLKAERSRVVAALQYCDEQGWIELKAKSLSHGYRSIKKLQNPDAVAESLSQKLRERESSEIDRIDQVYRLATATSCQSAILSNHFGQVLESPCGNCSFCTSNQPLVLAAPTFGEIGTSAIQAIKELKKKHPETIGDARAAARFLCGLTSPKFTATRLSRDPMFGCCSHLPYINVVNATNPLF